MCSWLPGASTAASRSRHLFAPPRPCRQAAAGAPLASGWANFSWVLPVPCLSRQGGCIGVLFQAGGARASLAWCPQPRRCRRSLLPWSRLGCACANPSVLLGPGPPACRAPAGSSASPCAARALGLHPAAAHGGPASLLSLLLDVRGAGPCLPCPGRVLCWGAQSLRRLLPLASLLPPPPSLRSACPAMAPWPPLHASAAAHVPYRKHWRRWCLPTGRYSCRSMQGQARTAAASTPPQPTPPPTACVFFLHRFI